MENKLTKIDNCIECYIASITEENKDFVNGVIYGLNIAKSILTDKGGTND